ncbi:hypothetical protein GCM10020000_27370 [Streptomyces olivoverticillatus]
MGRVDVVDGGRVEPWDVGPAGLGADRTGERRDAAARQVVREAAPVPRSRARAGARGSEAEPPLGLVLFTPRDGLAAYAPDPGAAQELLASGTPHLYAGVLEATGVVGPLVLPGGSACAGCLEHGRAEQDSAWPRMLAQWRSGRGPGGYRLATWHWPRSWRGSPWRGRWPSSTVAPRRARGSAWSWHCRVRPGLPGTSSRIRGARAARRDLSDPVAARASHGTMTR